MGLRSFAICAFVLQCVVLAGDSQDLTSLSFEEFMNIKVSSVNKSLQKVSRSAAAVYVISADDIRRSGATSLPEVLRLAPGVHVARIVGSSWAVGIRGFNNIYSNKLLVMIDGRTLYNPLMSGVLWSENLVMLDDIERIEVIRGPGATIWGANAVAGVINIITKSSKVTTGGYAAMDVGTFDRGRARVRYGKTIGTTGAWRAWGQGSLNGETYPEPNGVRPSSWPSNRGGARIEFQPTEQDTITVEGEVHSNTSTAEVFQIGSGTKLEGSQPGTTNGYIYGRWEHVNRRGDTTSLKSYGMLDSVDAGLFRAELKTVDLDVNHSIAMSNRHQLLVGGGIRGISVRTFGTPQFSFSPSNRTYENWNAFVVDNWEIVQDKLSVDVGLRAEHFEIAGFGVEPVARAMWTPKTHQGYWVSTSRALRTPVHTDYTMRVAMAIPGIPLPILMMGDDSFKPEKLFALEVGTRQEIHDRFAFDISLFRHYYSKLQGYYLTGYNFMMFAGVPMLPTKTGNTLNGLNTGGEVTARWQVQRGLQINGSYSSLFTSVSYREGFSAMNSFWLPYLTPKHSWQVRASKDLGTKWQTDFTFRRSGKLPDGVLAGFSQVDARIARKVGENGEISIGGRDLLRPYQRQFGGQIVYEAGYVGRTIEAGTRWRF